LEAEDLFGFTASIAAAAPVTGAIIGGPIGTLIGAIAGQVLGQVNTALEKRFAEQEQRFDDRITAEIRIIRQEFPTIEGLLTQERLVRPARRNVLRKLRANRDRLSEEMSGWDSAHIMQAF
jgi:hypothetical protein